MPKFVAHVKDPNGADHSFRLLDASVESLRERLEKLGFTVQSIEEDHSNALPIDVPSNDDGTIGRVGDLPIHEFRSIVLSECMRAIGIWIAILVMLSIIVGFAVQAR